MEIYTRPTTFPEWARVSNTNNPLTTPSIVEPPDERKTDGWEHGEKPPRQYFNWMSNLTYKWLEYLDQAQSTSGSLGFNFGLDPTTTTGLFYGYRAGFLINNGAIVSISAGVLELTANQTTSIYIDLNDNTVKQETGTVPMGMYHIAVIVTDATDILTITDKRTPAHNSAQLQAVGNTVSLVELSASDTFDITLDNTSILQATPADVTIPSPVILKVGATHSDGKINLPDLGAIDWVGSAVLQSDNNIYLNLNADGDGNGTSELILGKGAGGAGATQILRVTEQGYLQWTSAQDAYIASVDSMHFCVNDVTNTERFRWGFGTTGGQETKMALKYDGSLVFYQSSEIKASTSVDDDTVTLTLAGGGHVSDSRGAYLSVSGNEAANTPGDVIITSGWSGDIFLQDNENTKLSINSSSINTFEPIVMPSGSVTEPSLTFSGDTDTGIYSAAPGYINFSGNGEEAAVLTRGGGITQYGNDFQIGVRRFESSPGAGDGTPGRALVDGNDTGNGALDGNPSTSGVLTINWNQDWSKGVVIRGELFTPEGISIGPTTVDRLYVVDNTVGIWNGFVVTDGSSNILSYNIPSTFSPPTKNALGEIYINHNLNTTNVICQVIPDHPGSITATQHYVNNNVTIIRTWDPANGVAVAANFGFTLIVY